MKSKVITATIWALILMLTCLPQWSSAEPRPTSALPTDDTHDIERGIEGLVLVGQLPLEAELIENTEDSDGNYTEVLLFDAGAATLTLRRQIVDEAYPIGMPMMDYLATHFDDIRDATAIDAQPIAGYPTERVFFHTRAEEDSAVVDAVLIRTDACYFSFFADVPGDAYYGYWDDYAQGDLQSLIDIWVDSLDLFDAGA